MSPSTIEEQYKQLEAASLTSWASEGALNQSWMLDCLLIRSWSRTTSSTKTSFSPSFSPSSTSSFPFDAYASRSASPSTLSSHPSFPPEPAGISKIVRSPRWRQGIPQKQLRTINAETRAALFKGYLPMPPDKIKEAKELWFRLKGMNPDAASGFTLKSGDIEALTFRLIFPETHRPMFMPSWWHPTEKLEGYYALSYRWNSGSSTSRIENNSKCNNKWLPANMMALPTSSVMFEAIMDELPRSGYGLWCDQICIDEANEEERNNIVGMMDVIYKRATKVIVALDDIELDEAEVQAMQEFDDWYEDQVGRGYIPEDVDFGYMKTRPTLQSCVEKIIFSEYFDRAWCGHEFELASDRLVLIRAGIAPSTPPATAHKDTHGREKHNQNHSHSQRHRIIRIPNDKLHSLMLLLPLDAGSTISPHQASRRVNVELLISRSDRNDPSLRSRMVHDMQTLALIDSMSAGGDPSLPDELRPYSALKDKVSILLNACECLLQPTEELTGIVDGLSHRFARAKTYRNTLLLLLAAGNPLILTTTGRSLLIDETQESWMRKFWLLDAGIDSDIPPLSFPLKLAVDPSPQCQWIKLDLLVPACGGKLYTASDDYLQLANSFLRDYHNSHPKKASETDLDLLKARMHHMKHLIACVLECHDHHIEGKGGSDKKSLGGRFGAYSRPWQYFFGDDVQLAIEINKGNVLPPWDSPIEPADEKLIDSKAPHEFSWRRYGKHARTNNSQEQRTALEMAGELMSNLLLRAPLPESRGDAAAWQPAWFEVGKKGPRYIVMAPRSQGQYHVAVPDVLRHSGYADLARCWVLQKHDTKPDGHWIVRCRSKLMMMDLDALEPQIEQGLWLCKADQTIWGRKIDPKESADD